MHVLLAASWYPSKQEPLKSLFVKEQAQALLKAGVKVSVINADIVSAKKIGSFGYLHRSEDGVEVYQFTLPLMRFGKAGIQVKATELLMKYLYNKCVKEQGKPDIIHIHSARYAGPVSVQIAKRENIKCVLTEHFSKIMAGTMTDLERECLKSTLAGCDKVIAVSPALSERLKSDFNCESIYIPNVVNMDKFTFSPVSHKGFNFVSVGWLSKRKGMDVLIKAFSDAKKEREDITLTICGSGEEYNNLVNTAKQYGVENSVIFTGACDRDTMNYHFSKSDCFALASRAETFGVVYIEAMACGMPVIATRCGGPECIVDDSNGIMVDIDDADALTKAMVYMYDNRAKYDSNDIYSECKAKYGYESVAEKVIEVYKNIL